MRKFIITLTLAILTAPAAMASDSHSGHDHSGHEHSGHDMKSHGVMAGGVHAEATVNHLSADSVNVTHGPIAEIGWPPMTMDLNLLEGAQVQGVQAGDTVMMVLEKGPDGMFAVRALTPAD